MSVPTSLSSKIINILNNEGLVTLDEIAQKLNVDKEIIRIFLMQILKNNVNSPYRSLFPCSKCPFRRYCNYQISHDILKTSEYKSTRANLSTKVSKNKKYERI